MKKIRDLIKNPIFRNTLTDKMTPFNERYSEWSEKMVQAYRESGRVIKRNKYCTKEERLLRKKCKELRKIKNDTKKNTNRHDEIEQVKEEIIAAKGRRINNTVVKTVQTMKKRNGAIDTAKFWEIHMKLTRRRREPESIVINDKKRRRVEEPKEILKVYKEFYEDLLTPQQYKTEPGIHQEGVKARKFDKILETAENKQRAE